MNISGFNSSKILNTRLIELKMKLNNSRKINAIAVPEIRSKTNSNIDDIVKGFTEAGISLADRRLGRKHDTEVDILFGVDNIHVIPVHSCSFGREHSTAIYYTCQGVMLDGNIDKLRTNLNNLSCVYKFIDDFNEKFQ